MGARTRGSIAGAILAGSCLALALTATSARADDDPPAETIVVAPRLLDPVHAGYPDGAEGTASVMVAVTVGAAGNVQDARVLEGHEPFAERALEAVRAARFAPATRGGKAIAATIRFRIDFEKAAPPPPPPDAEPPPPPATTGVASAPPEAATQEPPPPKEEEPGLVLVRGGKGAAGAPIVDTLARTEVRQLPGAFGDPFRALEVAPGVTPIVSGLPYFYVRGAPPGNVGYYFDGVRVPYLFHFGLGPGVIQPSLVARTDIHKGAYPAALGRFAGGVVDAAAAAPSQHVHGEAQLRIIDGGGLVEAPFANGRGAALVGGRYSYTSALFSLLDAKTSLDYRDYQARVSYVLTDRDTVSLLVFGAYDRATQRTTPDREMIEAATGNAPRPTDPPREIEIVLFASEFHRLDLRWDHALGAGGHMRVATTLGFDRTRLEARRAAEDVMTAARFELEQPVGKRVLVRGGADVVVDRYHADSLAAFTDDDDVVARQEKIFAERTDFATGLHLDAVLLPTDRIEVTPGVRLDVYGSDRARAIGIDPRLTARFLVSDKVRIVHAYGLATQAPSTPIALPAATIARLDGGLQRSAQTSAGVEIDLPSDFSATGTVFHQAFYDLNDALGTSQVEIVDIEKSDALVGKTRGSAYGLEVGVRRKLSRRVGGFLSYTLSRSERQDGARTYLSSYDRPHVLNVAVSVDLGRHWRAGSRFVYYTGGPQYPEAPDYPGLRVGQPPSRAPDFVRIDARVEKRWSIGERGYIAFVIEALNATLSTETTGYRCQRQLPDLGFGREAPQCYPRTFGPVSIPSLGLEGGF